MTSLFLGIDETGWLVISMALNLVLLLFLVVLFFANSSDAEQNRSSR